MEDADSKSDDEAEDPTFKPSQDDIYDFESEASRDSYIARGFASLEGPAVKKARTTDEFIPDSNSETSIISMEIPNQWPGLVCDNSQEQATSPTSTAIEGKRKPAEGSKTAYDKKNFCTFCGKCSTKISRHLLSVHKDEMRVRPILFLEKRSTERMVNLELLANEGNFKHNMEVISKGSGFLVESSSSSSFRSSEGQIYITYEIGCTLQVILTGVEFLSYIDRGRPKTVFCGQPELCTIAARYSSLVNV